MSKIFEKSSDGKVLKGYWKQFAGWVIVLRSKWQEPLVKSEFILVLFQVAFAIVILILSYLYFTHIYDDTAILIGLAAIFTFIIAKLSLKPSKEAMNLQKRFIADIAHELRTPLSIIKTNNEVALMDDDINPKMKEVMKDTIEELDKMSQIINNVLSFNTFLRPKRVRFSNVDMSLVVDGAIRELKGLADMKGIDFTIKKITPYTVWGSSVALEQVITNLLKNAINYSPKGGNITIRLGPDYYGNVLIHIEDTGMGITKKDLMHIFEPFYRAERSRNKSIGSFGLGLSIARELVKMHSGRLTIRSAENKGTVAVVTIPAGKNMETDEGFDISNLSEISINFLKDKS